VFERPSLFRIARTDYLASLTVLAPVVVWGMAVIFPLLGQTDAAFYVSLASAVTVVALPVLLWRTSVVSNTLTNGIDVAGVISSAGFFRGRGRISYIYSYQGEKLQSSNAVQQNKQASALTVGSSVTVVLDPNNPKRAFIRDIYT
jgi:hypothetical protein